MTGDYMGDEHKLLEELEADLKAANLELQHMNDRIKTLRAENDKMWRRLNPEGMNQ